MRDLTDLIIAHESGELEFETELELFGRLVATGQAWTLQGHYGRTAEALIRAGYLATDGTVRFVTEEY